MPGVMPEDDFQVGIRGGKEWLGELEDGAVVAVDGVVIENGPSGVGILVEGVVDFQGSLFEGGLGIDEGELFSGLALMVEVNFERGEDEVSTVASADATVGVGWVAEGIEADVGDSFSGKRGGESVGEFGRVTSGGEEGAVRERSYFKTGVTGFGRGEGEGGPEFPAVAFQLLLLPVRLPGKDLGREFCKFAIDLGDSCLKFGESAFLAGRGSGEDGFGLRVTAASGDGRLIEEIEKSVVVRLG